MALNYCSNYCVTALIAALNYGTKIRHSNMAFNYCTQLRHSNTALNHSIQLRYSITTLNYGT